ncbi:MAG: GreA/GreB family elongation factor [Bdellovibrionales bacterium]
MDKPAILKSIIEQLNVNLDAAIAEAKNAKDAATAEESKAENKYDTRGLEASYIAQAQAGRASKIKEDIYNLSKVDLSKADSVSVGSLVSVYYVEQDKESYYFLLPCGGVLINYQEKNIQSLSLESPLGRALFKKSCQDSVRFRSEEIEILSIL